MPYNYFVCRKHTPPVRQFLPQPAGLPDTYASPACPTCGKTMQRYDTGLSATDLRPLPPPLPDAHVPVPLAAATTVYSGSEMNPGHRQVTWTMTHSPKQAAIILKLNLGEKIGGSYESELEFRLSDGLIDMTQGGPPRNWWVKPPYRTGAGERVWHQIDLAALVTPAVRNPLPPTIDVGLRLGNASFGLIHLLAKHSPAVRKIGPFTIPTAGHIGDDCKYVTLLALQSGMQRSATNTLKKVQYVADDDKLKIKGTNDGFMILRLQPGGLWGLTTIYNMHQGTGGRTVYRR